jgi:hypothetical protein
MNVANEAVTGGSFCMACENACSECPEIIIS